MLGSSALGIAGLLWAHGPERECISDARMIVSQVNEYHSARNNVGFFGTAVGQLYTSELMARDNEMITSANQDPANRGQYVDALDKNSSVESDRYLRFILDSEQRISDYREWEQEKLSEAGK
jgi:hypothetical protein